MSKIISKVVKELKCPECGGKPAEKERAGKKEKNHHV
jgi:hypothetical protein